MEINDILIILILISTIFIFLNNINLCSLIHNIEGMPPSKKKFRKAVHTTMAASRLNKAGKRVRQRRKTNMRPNNQPWRERVGLEKGL